MNKYTKTSTVSMNDVAFCGYALPSQIMSIFQDAVTDHTTLLGVGANTIIKTIGAKWVITRARFEIEGRLSVGDSYTVSTWPLKAGPLRFGRTFVLEKEGKTVAKAFTEWCLLDAKTDEVLRSSVLTMPIDEYLTDKGISGKFSCAKADSPSLVYTHTVRQSDLDINGHVNNITYMRFALDCLTTKELESIDIKSNSANPKMLPITRIICALQLLIMLAGLTYAAFLHLISLKFLIILAVLIFLVTVIHISNSYIKK